MRRRALFAALLPMLAPAMLAAPAAAQPIAPPPLPDGAPARPRRPGPAELTYDQLTRRQRQRVAQALAGAGNPPVPPDQAKAQWDGMQPNQKRQVLRAYRAATRASGPAPYAPAPAR